MADSHLFLLKKSIFTYADLYMEYFQKDKQEMLPVPLGIRLGGLNEREQSFISILYALVLFNFFYYSRAELLFK